MGVTTRPDSTQLCVRVWKREREREHVVSTFESPLSTSTGNANRKRFSYQAFRGALPFVRGRSSHIASSSKPQKMAASLQLNLKPFRPLFQPFCTSLTKFSKSKPCLVRCSAAAATPSKRSYKITLLPGDGIGPEVSSVAKNVLVLAGSLEGTSQHFYLDLDV